MKKNSNRFLAAILLIGAMVALLAPKAQAQVTPLTSTNAIKTILTLAHASTNIVSSAIAEVPIRQGKGVSVTAAFAGTGANTGTVQLMWAVSTDGTNYTTTTPITTTHVANGTTGVLDWELIPPSTLDNVRKIKIVTITNTPTILLTNVVVSYSN